jgi:hypothetical protein
MKSVVFSFSAILFFATLVDAQQKYIAYASGPQAGTSSTRHLIADATIMPPVSPGNAANIVFRGLGGTPFPANADLALCFFEGIPGCAHLPVPPDSAWSTSMDVSAEGLANFRQNKFKVTVFIPSSAGGLPDGEITGVFHLANGTYNDYDGDGKTDVQVYRTSTNTFYALDSTNGSLRVQPLGQPGDSVSLTVDFDGDGRSDFSTARYNAEVLWRIMPSRTNVLQETRWGSSTLGDFFAAADYDGDMRMDIGVFRAGIWHILLSSTGTYIVDHWGTSGDVPVLADFDRDGRADLSIARSQDGQRVWYTRMSTTGAMRVIPWGLSSDAFFTGRVDFDGDGAADVMVIRNQGGQRVFYILRSSDSQMQVIQWGLSSDVVKLGDYDGDGRTDAAVTRAIGAQRVFFILQSSNGQPRYETFGLAGDF